MRKSRAKKRILLPDPKFGDTLVTRFVNCLMISGNKQKAFKSFKYKCYLKNTEKITKECISLPMYPELSISAIDYIVEKINNYK